METEDIAAAAIRRRRHWHGQRYDLCLSRLPGRVELIGDAGVAVLDSTALKVAFYSSGVLEAGDGAAGGGTGADPMAFPHAYHQALITDVLDASVTAAIPNLRRRGAQGPSLHRRAIGLERPPGCDLSTACRAWRSRERFKRGLTSSKLRSYQRVVFWMARECKSLAAFRRVAHSADLDHFKFGQDGEAERAPNLD